MRKSDLLWEDDVLRLQDVSREFELPELSFEELESLWGDYSKLHNEEWRALPIDNGDVADIIYTMCQNDVPTTLDEFNQRFRVAGVTV